jgi:putative effector of murein hydrolase
MQKILNDPMMLVGLTIGGYLGVRWLQRKLKGLAIMNPTLWGGIIVIVLIRYAGVDFSAYMLANKTITFFLAPMTIALGYSMYEGWPLIKKYPWPLLIATLVSTISALIMAGIGVNMMGLEGHVAYSVIPKSVTSPIGLLIIDRVGGIGELAVFGIIWAGVVGNLFGPFLFKILRIKTALAQGYSLGAVAHVLGMARANEMGREQGSAASVAIGFTGILTILSIEVMLQLNLMEVLH